MQQLEVKKKRLESEYQQLEENAADSDQQRQSNLRVKPACLYDKEKEQIIWPKKQPEEEEPAALERVIDSFSESGMVFSKRMIYAFHTSLKTAVISPLTVLAGISGTGKSQLPRRYADAMGIHFLKIPVQPRWDGPQDLFGFYNYIENRYKATDLARALIHMDTYNWPEEAKPFQDRMILILLDEMNLARVEYYFSEFLSRLEGRPLDDKKSSTLGRRPSEIDIDVGSKDQPLRVYAGQNILFVGTMNEDESTQALSDKVMDRANILRFPRPSKLRDELPETEQNGFTTGYLSNKFWASNWMRRVDDLPMEKRTRATKLIEEINCVMDESGRPFGHRMSQAMLHYIANYPRVNTSGEKFDPVNRGLADQIEQRILPKLRGLDIASDRNTPQSLADIAGERLEDQELAEAIEQTIQHSENSIGIFNWRGFQRTE